MQYPALPKSLVCCVIAKLVTRLVTCSKSRRLKPDANQARFCIYLLLFFAYRILFDCLPVWGICRFLAICWGLLKMVTPIQQVLLVSNFGDAFLRTWNQFSTPCFLDNTIWYRQKPWGNSRPKKMQLVGHNQKGHDWALLNFSYHLDKTTSTTLFCTLDTWCKHCSIVYGDKRPIKKYFEENGEY